MSNRAASVQVTQIGFFAALALVLLRLAIGVHFTGEGLKKFDPKFSSAGLLRAAKGPLAPTYQSYLPNPYGYNEKLAQPRQYGSATPEEQEERMQWEAAYLRTTRAYDAAVKKWQKEGGEEPKLYVAEFPPHAPYTEWAEAIKADWEAKRDTAAKTVGAEEAEAAYREALSRLAGYLSSEEEAIADYRHELWRLAQMKDKQKAEGLPYFEERIKDKDGETYATGQAWPRGVELLEEDYFASLEALTETPGKAKQLAGELRTTSPLELVNTTVKWVVVGIGACMLLGFATRLAAVVGMGFLLSVMATQPPWVAGANTEYFGYQLVEVMAMLTIAFTGAGQWLGIDGALRHFGDSRARNN